MRGAIFLLIVIGPAGCQQAPPAATDPALCEPNTFSAWPSVTDKPVVIGQELWLFCRSPTPEEIREREANAKNHGPHASHSIVVRVNPEAITAFREGRPLPVGATVVKEKYISGLGAESHQDLGPLQEYAVMIKREAGYDPSGGDWEYAYVKLAPERTVSRGRLPECAGCHASAKTRDYLFRSYGEVGR